MKVNIEIVKANDLDPSKRYLIEIPRVSYTKEHAYMIAEAVGKMDVRAVVAIRNGDEMIVIKELPEVE